MMKALVVVSVVLVLFVYFILVPNKNGDKDYMASEDITFPLWHRLPRLNKEMFESESHNAYIDIHANEIGKKAYENQAKAFPVGSQIFKPLYTRKSRKSLVRLVVMVKREVGYDSENGDWWYGVYDKTGTEGWYQGRIPSCIKCHKIAKDRDYLFTDSVMETIEMQHVAEL